MLIGYARVSSQDQNPDLQLDALQAAGCAKIFVEKASGAQRERPELLAALAYLRPGDTLVVWKLDRLARSLKQLIETIEGMETRQIGFRSLTEAIDTTTSAVGSSSISSPRSPNSSAPSSASAPARDWNPPAPGDASAAGRPPALSAADLQHVKALLSDPAITVEEVARRLRVAPSTLYRHLPGGRSAA